MKHSLFSWYMKQRLHRIRHIRMYPGEVQQEWFHSLIRQAERTEFGRQNNFQGIKSIEAFQSSIPVSTYESFYPWIQKVLEGKKDVLWPGPVHWFAKSSGTTNDKSKFIPVSRESLQDGHFRAGKDLFAQYFENNPGSRMAEGKNLVIGGSHEVNRLNAHSRYGDLSAVLIENLPFLYSLFRTPSKKLTLMGEWEKKIEAIAHAVKDLPISSMTGVPTWLLVLFDKLFEIKGIKSRNLREVWPKLEVFFHGAVAFGPYRKQFQQLIPGSNMHYMETYNASEGFFAFQDDLGSEDLLLLLDHGIFYEFIPVEQAEEAFPKAYTLDQVETGKNYAMVISTNGGLWRYMIGDTIRFTQVNPFKILITGRTKHFINAFGEELIMENAERAIAEACKASGAIIRNYTAGPVYSSEQEKGAHEWIFEFVQAPASVPEFMRILDDTLKTLNSDYAAKRYLDMAMQFPRVQVVKEGCFYSWMKKRDKLGGQHKVPRLSNHRQYIDELLSEQ